MGTGFIRVALSRRNLVTLLLKLDGIPVGSECTIYIDQPETPRLIVVGEENEVHYAHPIREGIGAGIMHPETEDRL